MKPAAQCAACKVGLRASDPDDGLCHHKHEQVVLSSSSGVRVNVDAGISDFITRLWAAGFETFASCEGPEHAYVMVRPY